MRTEAKKVLGVIALQLCVLTAPAIADIEDGPPLPPTKGEFSELTFTISTTDGPFLPLEPIPFYVILANPTDEAVAGHRVRAPDGRIFKVYVSRNGQPFKEFYSRDRDREGGPSPRLFPAGFHEQTPGYLHYGRAGKEGEEKYLLPEPGTYQVKATLTNLDGTVTLESNVLALEVVAPQGADGAAYAYLKSVPHRGFLLLWKGSGAGAGIWDTPALKDLEAFVEKYSESRYAGYGCYALGMIYGPWGRTEADRRKGIGFLEKAALLENPFFGDRALSELVNLYVRFEELDKAKQALVSLLNRSKNKGMVWCTWERLREAIRRSSPLRRVEVSLTADWEALAGRQDLDRIGICFDAKDVAYLPMKGKALKNAARWKEPRTFSVPEGTCRVSLRTGESEADQIDDTFTVVLIPELEVKGDMSITVNLTDRHVAELDEKLRRE